MTKRSGKSRIYLTGGPYDKQTMYLSPGLGTFTFKVGTFIGYYDDRGYWYNSG